ncbi:MAG: hypothetical protein ACI87W_003301 [Halieaceae bacterium]|jgi:hypothetical protein
MACSIARPSRALTDMRRPLSVLGSLACALPLTALFVWVYAPALPFAYADVLTLLLESYEGRATPLSEAAMRWRQVAVIAVVWVPALWLLLRSAGAREMALAAVLGSLLLCLPFWVPWILSGTVGWTGAATLLLCALASLLLYGLACRLRATILPVAVLCILLGVGLCVISSARVTLRSNPPLYVLQQVAVNPRSAEANLAMGLHLLSLGNRDQAYTYLATAGRALEQRYVHSSREDVLSAAGILLALDTPEPVGAEVPVQRDGHKTAQENDSP